MQGLELIHNCGLIHADVKLNNFRVGVKPGGSQVHNVITDLGSCGPAGSGQQCIHGTGLAWLLSKHNPVMLHLQAPTSPASAESCLGSGIVLVTTLQCLSAAFLGLISPSCMDTTLVHFS